MAKVTETGYSRGICARKEVRAGGELKGPKGVWEYRDGWWRVWDRKGMVCFSGWLCGDFVSVCKVGEVGWRGGEGLAGRTNQEGCQFGTIVFEHEGAEQGGVFFSHVNAIRWMASVVSEDLLFWLQAPFLTSFSRLGIRCSSETSSGRGAGKIIDHVGDSEIAASVLAPAFLGLEVHEQTHEPIWVHVACPITNPRIWPQDDTSISCVGMERITSSH